MVHELVPRMSHDIETSLISFTDERETLSNALTIHEPKLVDCATSEDIMTTVRKNRLAFSIRMSKWMRQKSKIVDEFAQIHMWYRCVNVSTNSGGSVFAKKWSNLTGTAAPKTRDALFKFVAPLCDSDNLYEKSLALALFELLFMTVAPSIFEKDHWIQALAVTHVPWINFSGTRLLHPNVLPALLRSQCGDIILRQLKVNCDEWLPNEFAVMKMKKENGEVGLTAGALLIDC
ncbi:hypothetical protein PHMEG_0007501 [Phytophthora megakarya]|uniref:Uncharacterized protein n=1 Tax=Phytophthora megakarya TaxID=4795 RepID=A0A225WL10_9STRA|nr:hypothetical protein PHMEG_0007501 [Phytophthora megakarya]